MQFILIIRKIREKEKDSNRFWVRVKSKNFVGRLHYSTDSLGKVSNI